MYREITNDIEVVVHPVYVPEESRPDDSLYVFAYRVSLRNLGQIPVRLLNRHWIITDGQGEVREVKGPGVVGEQPLLNPGEGYEYSSFCPLVTPTGNMRGTYEMVEEGTQNFFKIKIPLFFLRDLSRLH